MQFPGCVMRIDEGNHGSPCCQSAGNGNQSWIPRNNYVGPTRVGDLIRLPLWLQSFVNCMSGAVIVGPWVASYTHNCS
jgi:hypothetical protein